MKMHPPLAVALAASLGLTVLAAPQKIVPERQWPHWRGPLATGASSSAKPPLEWNDTKNVRWKTEIPGRGSASPVVWGDRVFVLTAVPAGAGGQPDVQKHIVLAIDRRTGKVAWQQTAREEAPHEGTHQEHGTRASSSAVTDGEHVIASFESRGLYAYDMNGKLIWQKDLGDKRMRNQFGEGTTPVLHGRHLVVVWDHQGESFIVALDKRTGEELWRQKRDEIDSWATPLVVTHGGRAQVVTSGMRQIRSYDLETGELVWFTAGLTMNPIPSPVAADGMVFLTSGYRGNSLKAIRLAEAKGDITGTPAIVWTLDRDTPYVPSPLLYESIIYFLKGNTGILSAYDATTGKPHYQSQRLEAAAEVFASPVAAAGRVYVPGLDGTTVVLKHGPRFEVLAANPVSDRFYASPALVDGEMFLRGMKALYCIAESK